MVIKTERLFLRPFEERDYFDYHEVYCHPLVCRYERAIPPEAEAQEKFRMVLQDQATDQQVRYRWAVTISPDQRFRGHVSARLEFPAIRQWELGWTIHPDDWGRGYATEAAQAVLAFTFQELHAHRIIAFCHAQNTASERIMQKLGMTREAYMRESVWLDAQWWDELMYAILDREYAPHNDNPPVRTE